MRINEIINYNLIVSFVHPFTHAINLDRGDEWKKKIFNWTIIFQSLEWIYNKKWIKIFWVYVSTSRLNKF